MTHPETASRSPQTSCPRCGTEAHSGDRYCSECAFDLGAPPTIWDAVLKRLRSHLAGEYRIRRELGRGGQAAVFLADELALNREVAIKVLAPGSFAEEGVERFRREAQTIANLKHRHIVTIFSVRQFEELNLFVMQYVEGRSLAAIIAACRRLPLAAMRAVAYQVGSALQYAHRRNVVHRDVKPANVLFDDDGNAILTDFGIAKDLSARNKARPTGPPMGTPAYMSPEQCDQRPVSWASDQYSLGAMLHEMLTGHPPFEGSMLAVMQAHTEKRPPSIRAERGDCPGEVEWAIHKMLAKKPEDRWPSMTDALEALSATPLSPDDPIRDELRRLAIEGEVHGGRTITPTGETRLSLSVPSHIEVGERVECHLLAITGQATQPRALEASWSVSNEGIARFDDRTASIIGVAAGRVQLSASAPEGRIQCEVEVVPAVVAEVTLTVSKVTIEVGETLRYFAEARDRRGEVLPIAIEWSSSAPAVASVSADGSVSGQQSGSTRLTACAGGVNAERVIFVQGADACSIALSEAPRTLSAGEVFALSAVVYDKSGEMLAQREVRWTSSAPEVAKVDWFGVVTTMKAGAATITARSGSASSVVAISVGRATREAAAVHADRREVVREVGNRVQASADDDTAKVYRGFLRRFSPKAIVAVSALVLALALTAFLAFRGATDSGDPGAGSTLGSMAAAYIGNTGFALTDFVEQDFSSFRATSRAHVVAGRMRLRNGAFATMPAAWRVSGRDFTVHFEVQYESGDSLRGAGIVLRGGEATDGRNAGYFLLVRGAQRPGFALSFLDGDRFEEVAPFRESHLLQAGNNALDVVVISDTLSLYVNNQAALVARLENNFGGGLGFFAERDHIASFDNLSFARLVRAR